ncbi:MAG: hypothetical protein R2748_05595 [Bryobacterales bacterium]
MLSVVNHLTAVLFEIPHRVANHFQVLLFGHTQRALGVQVPALAKNGDDRRLGLEQEPDVVVLLDWILGMARRAESRKLGMLELQRLRRLEEIAVARIGAGPAASM